MCVPDVDAAEAAIGRIGYYRLKGYTSQFLDASADRYRPGSSFDDVLRLYEFNCALSSLLLSMTSKTEVALRARLCDALLSLNDPLVYLDPSAFRDKRLFWKNLNALSFETGRSDEVFIQHSFEAHDGQVPVWAAVEVMSFGTLSKFIRNLKTGSGTAFSALAKCYAYRSSKGNEVVPSLDMMSSWTHSVVILRNMCAHNSRIYNRSVSKIPKIPDADRQDPLPRHCGLYHMLLSMKYLRPSDDDWNAFVREFTALLAGYSTVVNPGKLHLPADWEEHLALA